jgi:hypothetical protein
LLLPQLLLHGAIACAWMGRPHGEGHKWRCLLLGERLLLHVDWLLHLHRLLLHLI